MKVAPNLCCSLDTYAICSECGWRICHDCLTTKRDLNYKWVEHTHGRCNTLQCGGCDQYPKWLTRNHQPFH